MARHRSGRLYEPIGDNYNRRCVSTDTKRSVVTSELKSRKIGESYRKTTLFCFGGIAVKPVDIGNNETLYKLAAIFMQIVLAGYESGASAAKAAGI